MATLLSLEDSKRILPKLSVNPKQFYTLFDCLYEYALNSLDNYPCIEYKQIFNLEYQDMFIIRDENGYYFISKIK